MGEIVPFMFTFTQKKVNPLIICEEDISITDIAHGLACCNRFAAQSFRPMSVAQHSVYVSNIVFKRTKSYLLAMQGLLHDASEAYLGDVTKWLKMTEAMKAYREAEDRAMYSILTKFKCKTDRHLLHPVVQEADKTMVRFELGKAFPGYQYPTTGYGPSTKEDVELIGEWAYCSWDLAEKAFLGQFMHLNTGLALERNYGG